MAEENKKEGFEETYKKFKEKQSKKHKSGKGKMYQYMDHPQLLKTALERDDEIASLNKQIMELKKQLLEMQSRLKVYEPEKYAKPNYMGYQADWSVIYKVVFILKRNFQALTSSQVMNELLTLEPFYKKIWNDPANSISSLLSRACKHSLIERISNPEMGAPVYKAIKRK